MVKNMGGGELVGRMSPLYECGVSLAIRLWRGGDWIGGEGDRDHGFASAFSGAEVSSFLSLVSSVEETFSVTFLPRTMFQTYSPTSPAPSSLLMRDRNHSASRSILL